MTKAITIIALTCFLVAGTAVTSILSGGGMQAIEALEPAPVVKSPVANPSKVPPSHDTTSARRLALSMRRKVTG